MKNNKLENGFVSFIVVAIFALAIVVFVVGYYLTTMQLETISTTPTQQGTTNLESDTVIKPENTKTENEEGEMMIKYYGAILAGKSAPLLDFAKADYDVAIASDKLVVLYFYANWCPICKAEVANALYPAFNELTTDKVVGIRISYKDNETDSDEKALAVKYGIPYQHTKVFVRNGKQILKAPDGWNKARYLAEINKALSQ